MRERKNESAGKMANWRFEKLKKSGLWGARGYYPKGEKLPTDEELLGQIVQVAKKDGSSQTKRITGIEEWFNSPHGWAIVRCEFDNEIPEVNGVYPNLPSAPQSAPSEIPDCSLNERIALFTPEGEFVRWKGEELWQPSPEIIKTQEQRDIPEPGTNENFCCHCQRSNSETPLKALGLSGLYECVYEGFDACKARKNELALEGDGNDVTEPDPNSILKSGALGSRTGRYSLNGQTRY